jgi:hypothetical protein
VHVALVGRRTVQRLRSQDAVARLFKHDRLATHVETEPTKVRADVRREQPGRLGSLLQLGAQLTVEPVLATVARLRPNHDIVHECRRSVA